jgi:radical SAM/Cys-rich protein
MNPERALQEIGVAEIPLETFSQTLFRHGLRLEREKTATLQINVGNLCNQSCRHCHLNAGPDRREIMNSETVDDVISYAARNGFQAMDITGGAPELNPNLEKLIEGLFSCAPRILVRSNLTTLTESNRENLIRLLLAYHVVVVASLPSFDEHQADAQRGPGTFRTSLATLKKLNSLGYGVEESGLELHLVCNPTGAFLPSSQALIEKRFREVLLKRWGIVFNRLFSFANVPLGRFRQWLFQSGNLESYLQRLGSSFNPCAVEGLMCRTLVSVSWDGYFYDCDFNLARDLPMGGRRIHVSEMEGPLEPGSPIAVGDHCYTCTAGAGFT